MNKAKMLVYVNSEPTLELLYKQFKENETVKKYPEYINTLNHIGVVDRIGLFAFEVIS